MIWHLTVTIKDGEAILFHGSTEDFDELTATAREARRLYPEAEIWIWPPVGAVYPWDCRDPGYQLVCRVGGEPREKR
jgi:hypothetical protein